MPIRPENREKYPKDWPAISLEVRRDRAGWRCECEGECGLDHGSRCTAEHDCAHPDTGSTVVLTVAHLDHDPTNNGESGDRPNLKAMCQRCHNRYDAPMRREGIRRRAREQLEADGQLSLIEES